jgi:hypothetical protein
MKNSTLIMVLFYGLIAFVFAMQLKNIYLVVGVGIVIVFTLIKLYIKNWLN